jgi:uncharacterized protein
MSTSPRGRRIFASLIAGLATLSTTLVAVPAHAVPAGHLVINEFYGRGGSANQPYLNKFVELYNPTAAAVDLEGLSLQYRSATSMALPSASGVAALHGSVAAGGYFVVAMNSNASTGAALPNVDQTTSLSPSGTTGTIFVARGVTPIDPTVVASLVDKLGYGGSNSPESAAAIYGDGVATPANSIAGSLNRTDAADTDNNAADFTFASTVTPGAANTGSSTNPLPLVASIAEIQGSGAASPLAGRIVITTGVVTAVYPAGGFNGFYLQTAGSGGAPKAAGTPSDGVFVFGNTAVALDDCVQVTGTAKEYNGLTEIDRLSVVAATGCAPVTVTDLATLPVTSADKEAYEGMLVKPLGTYTITNNYQLNQYGQLGLAVGDAPLYQSTDVVAPGAAADAYEAENLKKYITLDDGSSWDYMRNTTAMNSPLPYLSASTPVRTGSHVTFTKPVILDYRFQWNYQPTGQVVGSADGDIPVASVNDRETAAPNVGGGAQLASFNVLNYFTDLGQAEDVYQDCPFYADKNATPVTTNGCEVRGAWTTAAFDDQKTKIVAAINGTGAEAVALMEVENSAGITWIGHNRDWSLANLVDALNADAGAKRWAYVASPVVTPGTEDVIRVAFIYNPTVLDVLGPSIIDLDPAFADARYPLAAKFKIHNSGKPFVMVANHFKSKGSGADDGTGQGLSNPEREAQARQLTGWMKMMFADQAAFLLGDFNAYSRETPVQLIESAGYTEVVKKFEPTSSTYQFSGRLGSLDHIFVNAKGMKLVTGAATWDINGDESVAFQYSRRNYNVVDFYAPDPFASSDHDPDLVGISTTK